jgi:hypothetical protein
MDRMNELVDRVVNLETDEPNVGALEKAGDEPHAFDYTRERTPAVQGLKQDKIPVTGVRNGKPDRFAA